MLWHSSISRQPAALRQPLLIFFCIASIIRGLQSTLNQGIANFYDESSGLWESMWGEHMHHGYYPKGAPPKSNQEAQIDMIEEVLRWADAESATSVLPNLASAIFDPTKCNPCCLHSVCLHNLTL